ncbi:MAG: hypothetical protein DRP35_04280, partial [Candidatus Zixiibacteriota bacterium]
VKDAGNQPPVFVDIEAQSVLEGEELSFMIIASDPEAKPGENLISFPSNLCSIPDGATFQDLGNDTAWVTWTPTYCQAGVYTFSFVASDGFANSPMSVNVTVTDDPNNPPLPILDSIGPKSVKENDTLIFIVTSTVHYGCEIPAIGDDHNARPEGATWIDNGDGTGTFTWVPEYDQAGVYNLTFDADLGNSEEYSDLAADSEIVVVTVLEVNNQPPVFTELDKTNYIHKTDTAFILDLEAIDPDGTPVVLSIDSLPTGATFTDNGDGTGIFNFTPEDSGSYDLNFKAYDGLATTTYSINVTVLLGFGKISIDHIDGLWGSSEDTIVTCKPVTFYIKVDNNTGQDISKIKNAFRIVSYGDSLYYKDTILTDSTIDTIFYPDSLMNWTRTMQTLIDTGSFDTNLNQITFSRYGMTGDLADTLIFATDYKTIQSGYDSVLVGITIGPINPKFAGRKIALEPVLKKVDTLDSDDNLFWKWVYGLGSTSQNIFPDWGGPYVFTVADTPPVDNETPTISVPFTDTTINVCEDILTFNFDIDDSDGLPAFGATNLPENVTLVDSMNGVINFTWEPKGKEVGVFDITFFATDGCNTASVPVTITVNNPSPPIIVAPAFDTISFVACKESRIYLTGYEDINGGNVTFYRDDFAYPFSSDAPIVISSLTDSAYFSWAPSIDDIGEHEITFYLRDNDCFSIDSQVVTIFVIENEPPVSSFELFESDYITKTCDSLLIPLPWVDPEGYRLSYELAMEKEIDGDFDGFVRYRFAGSSANPSSDGDTLVWTPKYDEVGEYDLKLIVEDNCGNLDSQFFSISVTENPLPIMGLIEYNDGNDSGTIVSGDTISTNEETIRFDLFGSDPEDDTVFFEVVEDDLPDSAVFNDSLANSAQYILYPVLKGFYEIDLVLTDGCGEVPISFVVKFNYDVPPGVHAVSDVLPNQFELVQNFPNPFNPYTTIEFQIPKASHVQLEVFNVLGQRIKTLIDNELARNRYNVEWDGTNDHGSKVSSGIYFYRVLTEQDVATKKMLLLK